MLGAKYKYIYIYIYVEIYSLLIVPNKTDKILAADPVSGFPWRKSREGGTRASPGPATATWQSGWKWKSWHLPNIGARPWPQWISVDGNQKKWGELTSWGKLFPPIIYKGLEYIPGGAGVLKHQRYDLYGEILHCSLSCQKLLTQ